LPGRRPDGERASVDLHAVRADVRAAVNPRADRAVAHAAVGVSGSTLQHAAVALRAARADALAVVSRWDRCVLAMPTRFDELVFDLASRLFEARGLREVLRDIPGRRGLPQAVHQTPSLHRGQDYLME